MARQQNMDDESNIQGNTAVSNWELERNLKLRTALVGGLGVAPGSTLSALQTALMMAIDAPEAHLNGPLAKKGAVIQKPAKGSKGTLPDILDAFSCFANHPNAEDYILTNGRSLLEKMHFTGEEITALNQEWIKSLTPPVPEKNAKEGEQSAKPKATPDVIDQYVLALKEKLGAMERNPRPRIETVRKPRKDKGGAKAEPRPKIVKAADREPQPREL